jgi:hypothetical protein
MATASFTTSRFHNLSDAALADEIGRIDAIVKSAEAELKALKDEFKARGLTEASGDAYLKFETAVVSTVVRIKPAVRPLAIALAA